MSRAHDPDMTASDHHSASLMRFTWSAGTCSWKPGQAGPLHSQLPSGLLYSIHGLTDNFLCGSCTASPHPQDDPQLSPCLRSSPLLPLTDRFSLGICYMPGMSQVLGMFQIWALPELSQLVTSSAGSSSVLAFGSVPWRTVRNWGSEAEAG